MVSDDQVGSADQKRKHFIRVVEARYDALAARARHYFDEPRPWPFRERPEPHERALVVGRPKTERTRFQADQVVADLVARLLETRKYEACGPTDDDIVKYLERSLTYGLRAEARRRRSDKYRHPPLGTAGGDGNDDSGLEWFAGEPVPEDDAPPYADRETFLPSPLPRRHRQAPGATLATVDQRAWAAKMGLEDALLDVIEPEPATASILEDALAAEDSDVVHAFRARYGDGQNWKELENAYVKEHDCDPFEARRAVWMLRLRVESLRAWLRDELPRRWFHEELQRRAAVVRSAAKKQHLAVEEPPTIVLEVGDDLRRSLGLKGK